MARPFLALLFGRVIDPRFGAEATYFLHETESQDNMRGVGTHVASVTESHTFSKAIGRRLIFNELTL